jgi:hypothetical protein
MLTGYPEASALPLQRVFLVVLGVRVGTDVAASIPSWRPGEN